MCRINRQTCLVGLCKRLNGRICRGRVRVVVRVNEELVESREQAGGSFECLSICKRKVMAG